MLTDQVVEHHHIRHVWSFGGQHRARQCKTYEVVIIVLTNSYLLDAVWNFDS